MDYRFKSDSSDEEYTPRQQYQGKRVRGKPAGNGHNPGVSFVPRNVYSVPAHLLLPSAHRSVDRTMDRSIPFEDGPPGPILWSSSPIDLYLAERMYQPDWGPPIQPDHIDVAEPAPTMSPQTKRAMSRFQRGERPRPAFRWVRTGSPRGNKIQNTTQGDYSTEISLERNLYDSSYLQNDPNLTPDWKLGEVAMLPTEQMNNIQTNKSLLPKDLTIPDYGEAVPVLESPLKRFDRLATVELQKRGRAYSLSGPEFTLDHITDAESRRRHSLPRGCTELAIATDYLAKAEALDNFAEAVERTRNTLKTSKAEEAEKIALEVDCSYETKLTDVIHQKSGGKCPIEVIGYIGVTSPKHPIRSPGVL